MKTLFLALIFVLPSLCYSENSFIENKGQWPSEVKYAVKNIGMNTWITSQGIVYDCFKIIKNEIDSSKDMLKGQVVKMSFNKANKNITFSAEEKLESYLNYFIGNDQSKWAGNVKQFRIVTLDNLYDHVNVRYYFENNSVRYDFVIKPGGDPSNIKMIFEGQNTTTVNTKGELITTTSIGDVIHGKLFSFQKVNGEKKEVVCSFIKNPDGSIGIDAKNYDKTKELIIDPLIYSTFIGGNHYEDLYGMTHDNLGNVLLCGETFSNNLPITPGAYQVNLHGSSDCFVSKLSANGNNIIFSTYFGGINGESANDIKLDGDGNISIAGNTDSFDFPVTSGVYQTTYGGATDCIVLKLNSTGSSLLASTYIGVDNALDVAHALELDAAGNVYITGSSYPYNSSAIYPTTPGAFRTTSSGVEIIVTKFNPSLSALIYSTFIGGSLGETGYGISIDNNNNVIITGTTFSDDYPITNSLYHDTSGYNSNTIVTKLNSSGSALLFSGMIGGFGKNAGLCITTDITGNIYIAGSTTSESFPITSGAFQVMFKGSADGFVIKLNPSGEVLLYSTFLGGTAYDKIEAIRVDTSGTVYLTGATYSENFPVIPGGHQMHLAGESDCFLTILNSMGTALNYSTYFGGYALDIGKALTLFNGYIYVSGYTYSRNFPVTTSTFQTTNKGLSDGFVLKILPSIEPLKITSPKGGEIWKAGEVHQITWKAVGIPLIKLEYSTNQGISWYTININIPASLEYYPWTIPEISSLSTLIKISATNNSSINDVTYNPFRIWRVISVTKSTVTGYNYLDFGDALISLHLIVSTPADVTVTYYDYCVPEPVGLPPTIISISSYYWNITAPSSFVFNNGYISVPLAKIRDVPTSVVWAKRSDTGLPWTNIQGYKSNGKLSNISTFNTLSEFTIAGGYNFSPVELVSFNCKVINESVNLIWKTASEINNRGFEVQRSTDGINFFTMSFISGKGTTTEMNEYSWKETGQPGKYYYRLKQVDLNGSYEFSNPVEALITPTTFALKQNYPNPFNPSTVIRYNVAEESFITISMYNVLGECIHSSNEGVKVPGFYEFNFNGASLTSGIYIYSIKAYNKSGKNIYLDSKKMLLIK